MVANATRGTQWKYYKVFEGFHDRRQALRFEAYLRKYRYTHLAQLEHIVQKALEKDEYKHIEEKKSCGM